MKIAVICYYDCAKSAYHLYEAIKASSGHDTGYANYQSTREQYAQAISNADVIVTGCDAMSFIDQNKYYLCNPEKKMLGQDDIFEPGSGHPVKQNVIMIAMPAGKIFRRKTVDYLDDREVWPLSEYRKNYHKILPVTPELNYPELNDGFLPHAIDIKGGSQWAAPQKMAVASYLGEYDGKRALKYLQPAIEGLRSEGMDITLLISGCQYNVPHDEFINRMRQCTIYYGQINALGSYGRSEVEAMAMGTPVMGYISPEAKVRAASTIGDYGSPIMQVENIESIKSVLRDVYSGKIDLDGISRNGMAYARKYHSFEAVTTLLLSIIYKIQGQGID